METALPLYGNSPNWVRVHGASPIANEMVWCF